MSALSETSVFASIPEAIDEIRQGRMVIVVDDADRENEGDLIMAAERVTPEAIAFIVRHTSGVICMPVIGERLDELEIPLMVASNTDSRRTAFTVSVDARIGRHDGHLGRGSRTHDQGHHRSRDRAGRPVATGSRLPPPLSGRRCPQAGGTHRGCR